MDTQPDSSSHRSVAPGSIVVGIDGSDGADRALAWAAQQARLEHRGLTLVHAVGDLTPWAGEQVFDLQDVLTSMRSEGQVLLATARASLGTHAGLTVHTLLGLGDPRRLLLDLSREASLMVLGSRGRGPVASLLLGSVSIGVTLHAACPVVVVRPDAPHHQTSTDRVVVGVRTDRPIGHAVEFAFRQASLRGVPLRVVHGPWEEIFRYSSPELVGSDGIVPSEDLALATTLVAGLREKFPDVDVSYELARGLPDACLLEASRGSGLVVVGTEHPSAARTLLEGNVVRLVTEHAHGPVAVVPESDSDPGQGHQPATEGSIR
jgi:nucleotide-binding universal stress UspA family protein